MSTDGRAVRLHDLHPTQARLYDDVVAGLAATPPSLPPKYFYDEVGAALFEEITALPEYYPTRTELSILQEYGVEMAAAIGPQVHLVEFGSGSGLKTRLLLRALERPVAYSPVDISREQLIEFATAVAAEVPAMEVLPVCADYSQAVTLPAPERAPSRRVAFFPGSSLGNFPALQASAFLRRVRALCGDTGGLLIGVDLEKPRSVLEPAYNDAAGVTAAFNMNMLARLNRELGADFDLSSFEHRAVYDAEQQRIEMRLLCGRACTVTIPDPGGGPPRRFEFAAGDHITTEYSYKYSPDSFEGMAQGAGWRTARFWTDARSWFGVWLLEAV
jgi:dimethylhistidine N-methyltransferase